MITIGLIDDHELFRASLKLLLESSGDFNVSVEANNGLDFLKRIQVEKQVPDIVITDFQMPKMNGKAIVEKLKTTCPSIKTIVLSAYEHDHLIHDVLVAGACGFLSKNMKAEFLFKAINQVVLGKLVLLRGDQFIAIDFSERKLMQLKTTQLTDRQVEFLRLSALPDLTYKEIADYMHISPKTADRYRDELFKKLGINSKAGLLLYAIETGLYSI
ncbi:MAG TPA: hypothetical protein DHW64_05045 [Chitinophagaceae bacterium]|nr:hypothetical protein [Chitinophagaceae bacterium]